MAGAIALIQRNVRGLTMRGSGAGASWALVAARSRSCEGATCADAIVTDTALPEQTDAHLPDGAIILLSWKEIHEPMVLINTLLEQELASTSAEDLRFDYLIGEY